MTISDMASCVAIIAFAGGVGHYFLVRPYEQSNNRTTQSIDRLGISLDALQETLKRLEEKLNTETRILDSRVTRVEESTKSAHHRIDSLEGRVDND